MFKQKALLTLMALISFTIAFGCATSKSIKEPSANETAGKDVFTISHSFDADIKTVFAMWVDPEQFSRWLGPKDATMYFISVGVKEGETSQWSMTTADGKTKYGQLHNKIISPNDLLVYTQNFCDKDGNPARLPISKP
jgi:uncharacterized protein YndB with AHSA1/START domain